MMMRFQRMGNWSASSQFLSFIGIISDPPASGRADADGRGFASSSLRLRRELDGAVFSSTRAAASTGFRGTRAAASPTGGAAASASLEQLGKCKFTHTLQTLQKGQIYLSAKRDFKKNHLWCIYILHMIIEILSHKFHPYFILK